MRLLLMGSSTVHGNGYLDHAIDDIVRVLAGAELLFVPYALKDHDKYADTVRERLAKAKVGVRALHQEADPIAAVAAAKAIFVGGGNTMVLLRQLYDLSLLEPLRERVLHGVPYIGSSAGANIAGYSIRTTNDMPIADPPDLHGLELVPFNLNPHYVDSDPASTSKGETRDARINEFHEYHTTAVLALRESTVAEVTDEHIQIRGAAGAKLFRRNTAPLELAPSGEVLALADFLEGS